MRTSIHTVLISREILKNLQQISVNFFYTFTKSFIIGFEVGKLPDTLENKDPRKIPTNPTKPHTKLEPPVKVKSFSFNS